MVYASAENLAWMNRIPKPETERYTSEGTASNRYRAAYEEEGRNSDTFFPSVGIQPVTDGGLLAAALFLAEKFKLSVRKTPRSFLETMAVSNWCKFTVKADRNQDYLNDASKLCASLGFVVAELAALRPAVVLLPRAIWEHPMLSAAMRGATPSTHFIPSPQFNTTVVNCHLAVFAREAQTLREMMSGQPLADWMNHLAGFNSSNAWRYLAALKTLLDTYMR